MATTIIMMTMVRHRRWRRQLWRLWRQRFSCRSGSGWQVTSKGWTKRAPKLYSRGSGLRILDSENHSHTEGKIRGAKSQLRILDSENHSPTGAKSGRQNPGHGFWTRKDTHPRGAKSGGQNPGSTIPATDLELGKPVTHLNNIEDPQTQVLFRELGRSRSTSAIEQNYVENGSKVFLFLLRIRVSVYVLE